MKIHKSHHIFGYLGLLVLLFVIVFGVHYFQSNYSFHDGMEIDNTQDYEDGTDITNPFMKNTETEVPESWRGFRSDMISFFYPREYQLRINGMSDFFITAPYDQNTSCETISDEQARALCINPLMSPDISIRLAMLKTNPFITDMTTVNISGREWKRTEDGGEFGGTVWFTQSEGATPITVSYRYADMSGGMSFDSLHNEYGEQYQLTQLQQEQLVREIIATMNIS